MQATSGKWMPRFIWAAIVQGSFATIWTLFIVFPGIRPAPSMVIASGSAGTWLTLGYILYLLIGVIAVAVTALFYNYIENMLGKAYKGLSSYLAWIHFLLMNVGVAGATWLLMYAGYIGGSDLLATNAGGGGLTAGQTHEFLVQFVNPIGYMVWIAALGVAAGGLGYIIRSRMK